MARRPKAKPKAKDRKNTDKEQSERFKETARKLGADDSESLFNQAFKKIVPEKKRFQG